METVTAIALPVALTTAMLAAMTVQILTTALTAPRTDGAVRLSTQTENDFQPTSKKDES